MHNAESARRNRVGAYGFCVRWSGLVGGPGLLTAPAEWPDWNFTSSVVSPGEAEVTAGMKVHVGEDTALLRMLPIGFVEIDRRQSLSHFTTDHEVTYAELLHPAMASTAAVAAFWRGRLALHGAAVRDPSDGLAVAFVGPRESGKSSSTQGLTARGWSVVADDVLVIERTDVLAGPRIVDLRESTAQAWDVGTNIGRLGRRERWRVQAGDVPPAVPLKAIVRLVWNDEADVVPVVGADKLQALLAHLVLPGSPPAPRALLRLAGVPMFTFARAQDFSAFDDSMARLLAAVEAAQERRLHD